MEPKAKATQRAVTKCFSLPSIDRFVGEIGQKTAKTTTILRLIFPNLADIFGEKCWHGWNLRHPKHKNISKK